MNPIGAHTLWTAGIHVRITPWDNGEGYWLALQDKGAFLLHDNEVRATLMHFDRTGETVHHYQIS